MKRLIKESLLVLLSLILTLEARAEGAPFCEGESCFPETVSVLGDTLKKVSTARYRYYGFLVFDSALYASDAQVITRDFLGKDSCALRLCYHRTLKADDFRRSATETLALNPGTPFKTLQSRIDLLHAKYREVGEGDCYQIAFKSGVGTELAFNGSPEIVIPGDDFARYYLGIWLSPFSFSESLAKKLTTPMETN